MILMIEINRKLNKVKLPHSQCWQFVYFFQKPDCNPGYCLKTKKNDVRFDSFQLGLCSLACDTLTLWPESLLDYESSNKNLESFRFQSPIKHEECFTGSRGCDTKNINYFQIVSLELSQRITNK